MVLAFFPCTYFQSFHSAIFLGRTKQLRNAPTKQKLKNAHDRHGQLHFNYERFTEMFMVALDKGIRLIVENPYAQPHYLTRYFPVAPALIDMDRSKRGDKWTKPTQYWFVNCKPKNNFIFEQVNEKEHVSLIKKSFSAESRARERSEIHPDYANRFIREFIL